MENSRIKTKSADPLWNHSTAGLRSFESVKPPDIQPVFGSNNLAIGLPAGSYQGGYLSGSQGKDNELSNQ